MAQQRKVSSKLVLLQGIRRLAMPSRSFSENTMNVSILNYMLCLYVFKMLIKKKEASIFPSLIRKM